MVREEEVQSQSWKKYEYYRHTRARIQNTRIKMKPALGKSKLVRGLDNKEGSRLGCSSISRLCRTTWRKKRLRKRLQFM